MKLKMKDISESVTRGVRSLGLTARRHGPTGLVISGGVVIGLAIIQAVKDTRNGGDEVLTKYEKTKKKLQKNLEDPDMKSYDEKSYKKDLRAARMDTVVDGAKAYKKTAVKVVVGGGLIAAGYVIKNNQLKKTAVALSGITAAFDGYRRNVIEDQGEQKDWEYMHNVKTKKVTKTEVDPETGEEKTVEEEVKEFEDTGDPDMPAGYSRWARFFDESCSEWEKNAEYNLAYLKARQAEANRRLQRDGYLFLNDVYDMLGIPRTYEGQIYGWRYKKNNPTGDNYVDFGLDNVTDERVRAFVNGYENKVLLDFNVDGDILNTFPRRKGRK